jgi:hypothetical protein
MIGLVAAALVIAAPLQGILDSLASRDPIHAKQVAAAVDASPALAR